MDILRRVKVATPCDRPWDAMHGDERRRFCDRCRRDVVNLSEMTRAEAERFVAENAGQACVRIERLAPTPLRRGLAGAAIALSLAACERAPADAKPATAKPAPSAPAQAATVTTPSRDASPGIFDSMNAIDASDFGGGIGLMTVGDADGGGIRLKGSK